MVAGPEVLAGRFVMVASEPPRSPGQAVIRKAMDSHTGDFVAVKFLSAANDAVLQKLFDREVANLRALRHPNIVRLVSSGLDESGTPYIVLEWVERNLIDLFRDQPEIGWDEFSSAIYVPLVEAVAHVHLASREHRDVKPGNILLDADGRVVLADFGIGKSRVASIPTSATVQQFRSGVYAPPELSDRIHYVRDVFSLGVVAIQAMTPHNIAEYSQIGPALEAAHLPDFVRGVLAQCVDFDPANRPANAKVLATELARAIRASNSAGIVAANRVALMLTNAARSQLTSGSRGSSAEDLLLSDLTGQVFAELRRDENLNRDRAVIFLVGSQRRYTLKPEDGGTALVVTGVTAASFEELEAVRRNGLRVDELFGWLTRRPLNAEQARQAVFELRTQLDLFYARSVEAVDEPSEAELLLQTWSRTLAVREEVARREQGTIQYESAKHTRRESVFELSVASERDLTGTDWESPRTGGAGSWGVQGTVVRHQGSRVVVRWQREVDPKTFAPRGTVSPFLGLMKMALQRQSDAIGALRSDSVPDRNLLDLLSDPGSADAVVPADVQPMTALDADKQRALAAALGVEQLMVVKGPPGTGKTRFIVELVREYLVRNPAHRVLLVSQTHAAVDNALSRLDKAGLGGLVRLGKRNDDRVSKENAQLLLEPMMEIWSRQLRERAEDYVSTRASAAGIEPRHLTAALTLKQLGVLISSRELVESRLSEMAAENVPDEDASVEATELLSRLDSLQADHQELLARAAGQLGDDLTLPISPDGSDIEAALGAVLPDNDERAILLRIMEVQAEWLQRVPTDPSMTAAFLSTASVVAGTCVGFLSIPAVRQMEFDLCIFDEASRATATEALVPLTRSRKTVLVGDLNQLPPLDEEVLQQQDLLEKHNLDRSDIEETLFKRLSLELPDTAKYSLTSQYRMVPAIGNLISRLFYEGELVSKRTDSLDGYERLGAPVLWLSTSRLKGRRERQSAGGGFVNNVEANEVLARLHSIENSIESGVIVVDGLSVLVIAPYRSQVEELRRKVGSHKFHHLRIDVDSIDAVQGREADLVVLSLTRSNTDGRVGFLGRAYWRRINVALSRARFGLTVVGDAKFFSKTSSVIADLVQYVHGHPGDCEMREVDG